MRLFNEYWFEGFEMETLSYTIDSDILFDFAEQEVLYTSLVAVQVTVEKELVEIEVPAELLVNPMKDVHLELLRHSLRIVVGELNRLVVLLEVEGNHQ